LVLENFKLFEQGKCPAALSCRLSQTKVSIFLLTYSCIVLHYYAMHKLWDCFLFYTRGLRWEFRVAQQNNMMKLKYANYLALILVAFLFVGGSSFAIVSAGAGCNLSKLTIAGGASTAKTETVSVTATPSCWSGKVGINRGNVDQNLITVTLTNGHGSGVVTKIDTTQEVHPYGGSVRGNNIIIPCACSGTGLTKLTIAQTGMSKTSVTISITATPSTWAGTVSIMSSTGSVLATAAVPSSPGHATIAIKGSGAQASLAIYAVYSGIKSNTVNLP